MTTPLPDFLSPHGLTLISHPLCPYVQRAAIVLAEKQVPFTRIDIDLAAKPDWFLALSPTGKTPMLLTDGEALFESAAIIEYLDEIAQPTLHPASPLHRARHRGWIDFGSAVLNTIAGLYNAPDDATLTLRVRDLTSQMSRLDQALHPTGPWFAGSSFSLVDAVFGPVFRYFEALAPVLPEDCLSSLPRVARWQVALRDRPSVAGAVSADYQDRLTVFLHKRQSALSRRLIAA